MLNKAVFPGKYLQGVGAIGELPSLIALFGSQGLILASRTVKQKILPACGFGSGSQDTAVELFGGECCEQELARLAAVIQQKAVDVLIGIGGGKTIDTAKIAADRAGIPVIVIPTIASTDAPCSGCAVVYTRDGIFERVDYQKANPAAVLVDVGILAKAPTRFLVAGMGDALATWFEARSCVRTQSPNECGGLCTAVGLEIAKLCYQTLLEYGETAKAANDRQVVTPALEHIVEANILLSGIGFESAGLAAAHAVHNGLTALPGTHTFYHGEKVAFGTLTGLVLNDTDPDDMEAVFSFCEKIGLPTTLAEIGLADIGESALMAAAEKACESGSSIHHEAGTVTPVRVLNAMLAADAIGRKRKERRSRLQARDGNELADH